jgi:formylmethanofuran dehydrogenase subunit B
VADAEPTATSERADHFLRVTPEAHLEVLWALRALVKGIELGPHHLESATGIPWEHLRDWADRMTRARYGAFFFGTGLGRSRGGTAVVEAVLTLVRDLNTRNRFVALTLGGPGNSAGADAVMTWQAGFPIAVDFRRGYPREVDGDVRLETLLASAGADAALIVADDLPSLWTAPVRDALRETPTIILGPGATDPARPTTVSIATSTYGIHAAGTVVRSDGLSLPLRPAVPSPLPTDRAVLVAIESRLREDPRP